MTIDETLTVLEAIRPVPATAYEAGIHPAKLQVLTNRGLLNASKFKFYPAVYCLSPKGEAFIELLKAPVKFNPLEGVVARIQKTVALHFKIPVAEMWSKRRSREVARPRQIAMFFARDLTPLSLPNIGRRFGNRDHTTVIHAIKAVERLIATDPVFADRVTTLRKALVA